MRHYLLRRLLLLPPTLFGILLIAFLITRFVPGGPLEQAIAEKRAAMEARGGRGGPGGGGGDSLTPEQTQQLKEFYGFDRPPVPAFFEWLGAWPKELPNKGYTTFEPGKSGVRAVTLQAPVVNDDDQPFQFDAQVELTGEGKPKVTLPADLEQRVERWIAEQPETTRAASGKLARTVLEPWRAAVMLPEIENAGWLTQATQLFVNRHSPADPAKPVRVKVYRTGFSGVLEGEFGTSFTHGKPVISIIGERIPISLRFGICSVLLTYFIAIPLGVVKAVKHGGIFDTISSFLLFFAFSIPGYIIGVLILFVFAFKLHLLPHSGASGPEFATLGTWGKTVDIAKHTALPLFAMTVGNLAMMAMLMKNSLIENLGSDPVRTAIAKGVPFRKAVMGHAFRISLVPLATGFGHIVGVLLTGSFLIERIFDINGFGLLSFQALVGRDYPVFLTNLLFASFLLLIGNVLSDICVALVDPRIRFDK